MRKHLWLSIGWIFTCIGIIGITLPVVPTVPFFLVAAWAFAKSSPALEQRIMNHRTYGPPVRAWRERGAVGRVAKLWAITAMTSGVALSWWVGMPVWVVAAQGVVCGLVAVFLWTRPNT